MQDKGFSLRQLLLFYQKYEAAGEITAKTTTEEVVKNIIIRDTAKERCHYMASEFMRGHGGGKRARRLASHAWKAEFMNTVLNILLDATAWQRRDLTSRQFTTTEQDYGENFELYANGKLRAADLLQHLAPDILEKTFWLCIFAVNEHAAICGDCWKCNKKVARF